MSVAATNLLRVLDVEGVVQGTNLPPLISEWVPPRPNMVDFLMNDPTSVNVGLSAGSGRSPEWNWAPTGNRGAAHARADPVPESLSDDELEQLRGSPPPLLRVGPRPVGYVADTYSVWPAYIALSRKPLDGASPSRTTC